ncbi:selenium cofactor biosynthesis protein YqeC [Dehalobacterium formicoaceticum]|uniref:selenium cofactor biosynthesis protein YqeC n=1 Tax=Dehalobacterium formicoaceticum TaxID=51515 RepID=UPI000B7E8CAC|nr:selenium cofactor biosynthesis protein YqeC [Dehalobacterium formicoaceticum]
MRWWHFGVKQTLQEAFSVSSGDLVIFVGGGGKTGSMNRLAIELMALGKRVIYTTTTKIFPTELANELHLIGDLETSLLWERIVPQPGSMVVLGKEINSMGKIVGLDKDQVNGLMGAASDLVILVEGDGANGKPFKAPRDYEPVIPEKATIVVPVVGIDALDKPLDDKYFHAWEQISALTDVPRGGIIRGKDVAQVFLHGDGYQKGVPDSARWIPFINKADTGEDEVKAQELAGILKEKGVARVVFGSLRRENNPVEVV